MGCWQGGFRTLTFISRQLHCIPLYTTKMNIFAAIQSSVFVLWISRNRDSPLLSLRSARGAIFFNGLLTRQFLDFDSCYYTPQKWIICSQSFTERYRNESMINSSVKWLSSPLKCSSHKTLRSVSGGTSVTEPVKETNSFVFRLGNGGTCDMIPLWAVITGNTITVTITFFPTAYETGL